MSEDKKEQERKPFTIKFIQRIYHCGECLVAEPLFKSVRYNSINVKRCPYDKKEGDLCYYPNRVLYPSDQRPCPLTQKEKGEE